MISKQSIIKTLLEKHSQVVFAISAALFGSVVIIGFISTMLNLLTEVSNQFGYLSEIQRFLMNNLAWLFLPAILGFIGMMASLRYVVDAHFNAMRSPAETRTEGLYRAFAADKLAESHYKNGDYINAIPLFEEALKLREQELGIEHPDCAISLNNLAYLYKLQGEDDKTSLFYKGENH
jgi:tetratricopeptide (TPR) repeat protein